MTDFVSALNNLGALQQSLSQYVVTPLTNFGVAGFMFDIQGEARAELTNEITDHYTEDNSVIQDHIAVKPKRITLRNYIGELVYEPNNTVAQAGATMAAKLTTLSGFLPQLSDGALQAYNFYQQAAAGVLTTSQLTAQGSSTAANLYGLVKNLLSAQENKQQSSYQFFKALRDQRMLFSIQTPYEFMTNMAIENMVAIQEENTIYVSTFAITFKEMRFASTTNISGTLPATSVSNNTTPSRIGRCSLQAKRSIPVQQGSTTGQDVTTSRPSLNPPSLTDLSGFSLTTPPPPAGAIGKTVLQILGE